MEGLVVICHQACYSHPISRAGCSCSGKACRLCCICCPPVYESTTTRFMYIFYLFLGTVVMILTLTPQVQEYLINHFPKYDDTCKFFKAGKKCELLVGHIAVYRIALAYILFFSVFSLILIGTKSSSGFRGGIQNGYWCLKFVLLIGLCVGFFHIPELWVQHFISVFMYVGTVGAFIFILIQLLLLINMCHSWSNSWKNRSENRDISCNWIWKFLTAVCGVGLCIVFILVTFFLFYYYTRKEGCSLNKIFLGLNSSLSVFCMFLAILPCSSKVSGGHFFALLQSSLISLYVMYLTYCALSSEPVEPKSLPVPHYNKIEDDDEIYVDQQYYCGPNTNPSNRWLSLILPFVGVFIMFGTVIYSSIGTASWNSAQVFGIRKPDYSAVKNRRDKNEASSAPPGRGWDETARVGCCLCCYSELDEMKRNYDYLDLTGGQPVIQNDKRLVSYSYSLFHLVFTFATLYIMMQLTNWTRPHQANLYSYNRSWVTVWIRISSSWCCIILYVLTLLTPGLCPGQLNRKRHSRVNLNERVTTV